MWRPRAPQVLLLKVLHGLYITDECLLMVTWPERPKGTKGEEAPPTNWALEGLLNFFLVNNNDLSKGETTVTATATPTPGTGTTTEPRGCK